jgi:glucose/arabinose dehydrogenase
MRPRSLVTLLAVWGCAAGDPPPRPGHDFRIAIVAKGLVVPWSIALAPDGRLFVAERPGRIRVVVNDSLVNAPWATIPAFDGTGRNWETGLMGLALDPDFPATPFVYVCYTQQLASAMVNRVARLRERDGRGGEVTILLDGIPAGTYHNGCRVKVGPDRKLYVTTGDAYLKAPAQDMASLAGKVLRLNLDGSIPADNPTPGSAVWSLGHRNPQGIAWDPQSGIAFLTEHGDTNIDEINVLERGANYGWPDVRGNAGDPRFKDPALVYHVAPTGATFLADSAAGDVHQMLITSLSGRLIRLAVRGTTVSVADDSVLVGYGRLRDVAAGPDGSVYVATSNRDGRGKPLRGDDRILRIWLREVRR